MNLICKNKLKINFKFVSFVYLNLLKTWVQFGTGSFRYRDRHHRQSQTERPWLSMSVCFFWTSRPNSVCCKYLNRLKTNTLVSAKFSSGIGQLGIDYLTVKVKSVYRREIRRLPVLGFTKYCTETPPCAFVFSGNESRLQEAKCTYIRDFLWVPWTHRG